MKSKHVFLAHDVQGAARAVTALRQVGIADDDIALIARHDLEMESIPEQFHESRTDFMPAAAKGALGGGATGLVAGLIAVAIPPLGVTLAGAAAIAAVGAAAGTWSASLMGSALPDPVRQKFEDEVKAGRVLIVVDATDQEHANLEPQLIQAGARRLEFEENSQMT
jgi:hypothetical protein